MQRKQQLEVEELIKTDTLQQLYIMIQYAWFGFG